MSHRRPVTYIKPEEPAFLKALKKQVGYVEPPTVDTKRIVDDVGSDSDRDDRPDEKPVVIVLENGDLTAEEAHKIIKEKEETKADLSKRVIFKSKRPKSSGNKDFSEKFAEKRAKTARASNLLSFDDEDDDHE